MFLRLFCVVISTGIFFQISGYQVFAQTQENCQQELQQATTLFQSQSYDSALNLINGCLAKSWSEPLEKATAYKLLGKVKVALNDSPGAKAAFREMLSLQPFMELDPKQETPETIKIFKEVRIAFLTANPSTKGAKNWPWVVVSGAVVFTVGVLLFFK